MKNILSDLKKIKYEHKWGVVDCFRYAMSFKKRDLTKLKEFINKGVIKCPKN